MLFLLGELKLRKLEKKRMQDLTTIVVMAYGRKKKKCQHHN